MHSLSAAVCSKHFCTKSSFLLLASSTHFSHSTNCRLHDPPFMYAQKPHVSSSSSSFSFTSSSSSSSSFDCCVPVMMEFLSLSLSLSLLASNTKKVKHDHHHLSSSSSRRTNGVPRRDARRPRPSRARPRAFSRVKEMTTRDKETQSTFKGINVSPHFPKP